MRELRESHSQTELPILIVTAMTRTTDLLQALEIGANDYLTKPFEKEEFLLRVSNLTTLAREHRGRQTAVREAARNERERINADLHDHLGAALTDLKIMSDRATRDPELDPGFTNRLREKVGNAIRILREDMLDLEDHELLDENFLEGLQLMLLRRYVDAGRRFIMHVPDDASVAPEVAPVLLTVLKEMVTNDLKYGEGPATLRLLPGPGLQIEFESLSRYRLESHGAGRGTGGMIRRLNAVGGQLRIHIEDDPTAGARPVLVDIHIPTGLATERLPKK
jgi:two-component system sensor histidine kinase ChiS